MTEWEHAAVFYSQYKEENRYSQFCRRFAEDYFDDMSGLCVLDAGCGDGEYTEMFRRKGAIVTGCDGSAAVIARARETHLLCRFDTADLCAALPYEDAAFDLVFSNLVLMDIEPIDVALGEFARVLKPGGRLFFSVMHPVYYRGDWVRNEEGRPLGKLVTTYLAPQRHDCRWGDSVTSQYHRPISFYFNRLARCGFVCANMFEPNVYYEEEKRPDLPLYLFAECRREL